jgi:hypothetical protein
MKYKVDKEKEDIKKKIGKTYGCSNVIERGLEQGYLMYKL